MKYPGESGSFIHASGIEYTIDEGIPSSVKLDETEMFLGVDGEYRVKNVLINAEPLDTSKTYTVQAAMVKELLTAQIQRPPAIMSQVQE